MIDHMLFDKSKYYPKKDFQYILPAFATLKAGAWIDTDKGSCNISQDLPIILVSAYDQYLNHPTGKNQAGNPGGDKNYFSAIYEFVFDMTTQQNIDQVRSATSSDISKLDDLNLGWIVGKIRDDFWIKFDGDSDFIQLHGIV